MAARSPEWPAGLLKGVSRSFYLTVRVLPNAIRPQIGLAYLLARATDTIADSELAPVTARLQLLEALRQRILRKTTAALNLSDQLNPRQSSSSPESEDPETTLLEHIEPMLHSLDAFSLSDQQLIRQVLDTITSGQALDLERFGCVRAGQIIALQTDTELDDYTYRVAGCV